MESRLYRSRNSKIIGGVAGGIADNLNIDPTIVRLIFVLMTFAWGISLLAYIILWIITPLEPYIMPENQDQANVYKPEIRRRKSSGKGKAFFGYFLILIGIIGVMHKFIPNIDFSDIYPFVLMIVGCYIVFSAFTKKDSQEESEL